MKRALFWAITAHLLLFLVVGVKPNEREASILLPPTSVAIEPGPSLIPVGYTPFKRRVITAESLKPHE